MAKRDYALLSAAGLSVAEAAKILGRTKQAIYSGMNAATEEKPYFSAQEACWVWQDAKQRDSRQLDQLLTFVAEEFPKAESDLILQYRVGFHQVCRVIAESDQVVVAFNGNLEELDPNSTFAKILTDLISSGRSPHLVLPAEWVAGYIKQTLRLEPPQYELSKDLAYLPSFVVVRAASTYRAFFFQRFSPEECKAKVAEGLWEHFGPKSSAIAPDKSRAVG